MPRPQLARLLLLLLPVAACNNYRNAYPNALARGVAPSERLPAVGAVPDSTLRKVIREGDLIILGTPVEMVPDNGFLTAAFQLGAQETWYDVRIQVDSVVKGRLGHAKKVDYGLMPAFLTPPEPFDRLAKNEIVVQYPSVSFARSRWARAPVPLPGERAVLIFDRCYYCLTILGFDRPYKANPLIAQGWGSKLDPAEWPRVTRIVVELKQSRRQALAEASTGMSVFGR
jgi:hypothetical protein